MLNGILEGAWLLAAGDVAIALDLPPSARVALGIALGVYLLVLTGLSIVASKKVSTQEDYLVAGRNLPLFLCWGTLIATWFGAATMTAASEAAREEGFRGVILDPFACSATLIFAGLFFAAPMWRMKLLTTGDFFRRTYGTASELVAGCIQVPSYFGWIALQYTALADMQRIYFGIPTRWGIIIACGVTLAYTLIGGMWSVTLTDTLQIVVAFFGLLALAYSAYSTFGDGSAFEGIDRLITQIDPEMITLMPPAMTAAMLAYWGAWATGLFGNIPGQDLQQRIFSAKDEKTAARACILAGILYLCFGMIPVSLGLISALVEPHAKTGILQLMAGKYLSPALAVVFVISFTSIVVSTATSAVLAPATILGHNLLGRFALFRNRGLILDRTCVFLISMGGFTLTFLDESKMGLLDLALSMQLVALFIPLAFGLYGRPRSQWSGMLAMILGISCFLVRWLPENLLLMPPYHDYVAFEVVDRFRLPREPETPPTAEAPLEPTRLPKLSPRAAVLRDLLLIPDKYYGFFASLIGYLLGQALFFRNKPINDQTLKDAWGENWNRFD
jgi:Na+/proline symporter